MALALGHRVQVRSPAGVGDVAGQVESQLGDAVCQLAAGMQPRVSEHLQHRVVLGHHHSGKGPHSPVAGSRHQVLEKQGCHTPVMGMVGDGERDLRRVGPPAYLVDGDTYEFPGQPGEQGGVVGRRLPAGPASRLLSSRQAHAEEAQVNVVGRHRAMHLPDGVEVAGGRRPDLDRGAVGEKRVHTAGWLCLHAASPLMRGRELSQRARSALHHHVPGAAREGGRLAAMTVTGPPECLVQWALTEP
jgi:hypothetical protein